MSYTEYEEANDLTGDELLSVMQDGKLTKSTIQKVIDSNSKVYMAIVTQSGTGTLVPTLIKNTLGATISFARVMAGHYTITANNSAFTENKTLINENVFAYGQNLLVPMYYHNGAGVPPVLGGYYEIYWSSETLIQCRFYDNNSNLTDISGIFPDTGFFLKIEVYQ